MPKARLLIVKPALIIDGRKVKQRRNPSECKGDFHIEEREICLILWLTSHKYNSK